jgi:hypothetical protein
MNVQEIEVTILKNGQVQVQVRGVKGAECLDITAELEQSLGGKITLRELTPEALEELVRAGEGHRIQPGQKS